jgi:TonB family protein
MFFFIFQIMNTYFRRRISTGKYASFMSLFMFMALLSACSTPQSSVADKKNYTEDDDTYKRKFDVSFDPNEKPIRYWYNYIVTGIPEGYRVRVFHPDKKTLTEDKTYSTPALTLLHGPYKSFWDDGSIRTQGAYQYGRRHGAWLESEAAKGKSSSGEYVNDKREGLWTQLDTNGMIESVYNWHDGLLHGKFYEYDGNGNKINEGIYRADTLIGELFKRTLVQKPYLNSCKDSYGMDVYICTESMLMQKIYSELKYPPKARQMNIEGTVVIQWEVLADGTVANLRVPASLSDEIEAECLHALSHMNEWAPALKDGVAVKSTVTLPVNFKM